jgi:shikimate dehydrogenase
VSRSGGAALGSPIGHSLSPVLHQAAYDALGLSGWSFRTVECVEAELASTLSALDAEGLVGVGLTMPLKRAVMPMLLGCDEWASTTGAANTVVFSDIAGEWRGANTDVPGMVAVLRAAGVAPADNGSDGVPLVIGAGATAGSALAALAEVGYPAAVVAARRPEATGDLRSVAQRVGIDLEVRPWSSASDGLSAPLVIAATPSGATDGIAAQIAAVSRNPRGVLFDVIYSPWPTALAQAWSSAGGRIVGGLELLVEQAVEQVRLMTGQRPPVEALRRAGYAALGSA